MIFLFLFINNASASTDCCVNVGYSYNCDGLDVPPEQCHEYYWTGRADDTPGGTGSGKTYFCQPRTFGSGDIKCPGTSLPSGIICEQAPSTLVDAEGCENLYQEFASGGGMACEDNPNYFPGESSPCRLRGVCKKNCYYEPHQQCTPCPVNLIIYVPGFEGVCDDFNYFQDCYKTGAGFNSNFESLCFDYDSGKRNAEIAPGFNGFLKNNVEEIERRTGRVVGNVFIITHSNGDAILRNAVLRAGQDGVARIYQDKASVFSLAALLGGSSTLTSAWIYLARKGLQSDIFYYCTLGFLVSPIIDYDLRRFRDFDPSSGESEFLYSVASDEAFKNGISRRYFTYHLEWDKHLDIVWEYLKCKNWIYDKNLGNIFYLDGHSGCNGQDAFETYDRTRGSAEKIEYYALPSICEKPVPLREDSIEMIDKSKSFENTDNYHHLLLHYYNLIQKIGEEYIGLTLTCSSPQAPISNANIQLSSDATEDISINDAMACEKAYSNCEEELCIFNETECQSICNAEAECIDLCTKCEEKVCNTGIENCNIKKNCLNSDATKDGRVNILDLIYIRARLNREADSESTIKADVDKSGRVNIADLIEARKHMGRTTETCLYPARLSPLQSQWNLFLILIAAGVIIILIIKRKIN